MTRRPPLLPLTVVRFTRHSAAHGLRDREIEQTLVCDALVNGIRKAAAPGTAWYFGRKVAVLARQVDGGQVTEILTAFHA